MKFRRTRSLTRPTRGSKCAAGSSGRSSGPARRCGSTDVTRSRERGFLSAVLCPGTRAVSIGVDQVSGVAGLIWPGDQVDVILTQEFTPADRGRIVTSETILTDVRVIAVDQDIAQGAGSGTAGKMAATVTFEVYQRSGGKTRGLRPAWPSEPRGALDRRTPTGPSPSPAASAARMFPTPSRRRTARPAEKYRSSKATTAAK